MAAIAVALGVALAGCGGSNEPESLNGTMRGVQVSYAELALASNCLDGSEYGAVLKGVENLIRIFRRNPDAIYGEGSSDARTMREVLADAASTAEDCVDRGIAAELDRVLDAERGAN